ncbi:amidoligase family protein [Thermodesulfovibrio yellowstonii]|uniref:amidoligase family protein n=1 Tax=Thermodesulfovibrio yellowstonii TaxID=28262 RepID=UPI00041C80DE|nr:amidoligase family protein [Thermodesulfovibrio islandicus]
MPISAEIFDVNTILSDENLDELTTNTASNTSSHVCPVCGSEITEKAYECPFCGVLLYVAPKRQQRAERELVATIDSSNYNGKYQIYKLNDGTYFCTCMSFLFQRGVQAMDMERLHGMVTCKHIRGRYNINSEIGEFKKATEWQKVLLKKLGVNPHPNLSSEQAYWIIYEILEKMDVTYKSFIKLVKENPRYELLPLYSYGVELEGLVRSRSELANKLQENGIPAFETGYSHQIRNCSWRVGDDGSVRNNMSSDERQNFQSLELTSSKLFSVEGFREIRKVCSIWAEVGGAVNKSCGFHVHVDAWNLKRKDLKKLIMLWTRIEEVVQYLVSPSRRDNQYCRLVRNKPEEVASLLVSLSLPDRYMSLNLKAFRDHKTVEFRIHQGTMNPDKIVNWVIFCLKTVEAAKKGVKHTDFSDVPTIEEVLDKIGITENAIPVIRGARNYFIERYNYFRNAETDHPSAISSYGYFKENLIRECKNIVFGRHSLTTYDPSLPPSHIQNLASNMVRNFITLDQIRRAENGNEFNLQISSGSGSSVDISTYNVVYNPDTEQLSCSCRAFRREFKCYHTSCVAKYLILKKKFEKIVRFIETGEEEMESSTEITPTDEYIPV